MNAHGWPRTAITFSGLVLWASFTLLGSGCKTATPTLTEVVPAGTPPHLTTPLPVGEHWSGVTLNDVAMGYGHFKLSAVQDGFMLATNTELRFRMLDTDKSSRYSTQDWVDAELRLQRFSHRYEMDHSLLQVEGRVLNGKLDATITNAAGTYQQSLRLDGPVYPAAAQLLYPVLAGLQAGAHYRYPVYDGESQRLNYIEQEVVAYEQVKGTPTWRVETIMNQNRSTSWIDSRGLPVYEQAANGSIEAHLIDREEALRYLEDAAQNSGETLLNYSLIRTGQVIGNPRRLRRMVVELTGLKDFTMPTGNGRQQCIRENNTTYICTIDAGKQNVTPSMTAGLSGSLAANPTVPADNERIQDLAYRISGDQVTPLGRITALINWIGTNIKGEAVDSFSALDVLEQGRGECQGQSFLYAALARALGIPTRVVNGLVYTREQGGFLYHTWVESWDGNTWLSIDPTFRQLTADATHIALLYGENLAEFAPLMNLMGQLQAGILEAVPG